jgi:dTDP-4-amino-4,6-dideoxygalactose transaminase
MTNKPIAMCDLKAAYNVQRDEIDRAVARVLESGWFVLGQECTEFENEFSAFCGVPSAAGVANGTDALVLALKGLSLESGDGVITVSHTAVATVAAIEWAGATPILVDISPNSYTMCPDSLREAIATFGAKIPIKAVIPVHLYGHPCDMTEILAIAREHGLRVIEDCSQAHGAKIRDQCVGSFGDFGTFSLYPTKNLGAFGDGGIVVSHKPDLIERIRLLRQYGWKERYISSEAGSNSRLDEIQAAILRVRLSMLEESNNTRRANASFYKTNLELAGLVHPEVAANVHHVYHQYTVTHPERDRLHRALAENNIASAVLYPMAVHQQPAYSETLQVGLGVTEDVVKNLLCVPVHPQMSTEDLEKVIETLNTID